ncbi:ribosome biogenesis protein ytm1 [Coemansia javaensis]|uniref:Ribosome biogenesis protein YTM1 n=1 Tax=Coemansia javaensis TaxID=2761396 RepID=A0A9W8H9S9_9FUNG|nr:ribosome biogenesis protein ytm1 [Coemansia javaensis]
MESSGEAQVQVRLVAKQKKYEVPDAPIVVPQQLQRYGLSEIVNHLLGHERPVPFDFLVGGQFLRESIAQYLRRQSLSAENILTLEYVESMLPPTEIASFSHDDWISSVAAASADRFVVGSFDGVVRVWSSQSECEAELRGHAAAVKGVAAAGDAGSRKTRVAAVSGSQDRTAIGWGVKGGKWRALYAARGHTDSVEAVAVNPGGTHFVTASADATIRFWTLAAPRESEDAGDGGAAQPAAKKRRAGGAADVVTKAAIGTLSGHVGPVTSVRFSADDETQVFSGGWDHTVRTWDVAAGVNVATSLCDAVVLGVDYSAHSRLVATGHADRAVRLWDPRASDGAVVKLRLTGHAGFVPAVSWAPGSAHMLASASHDGSIKVWDVRSRTPLYTVHAAAAADRGKKLLALDWHRALLLAGGESGSLRIHSVGGQDAAGADLV